MGSALKVGEETISSFASARVQEVAKSTGISVEGVIRSWIEERAFRNVVTDRRPDFIVIPVRDLSVQSRETIRELACLRGRSLKKIAIEWVESVAMYLRETFPTNLADVLKFGKLPPQAVIGTWLCDFMKDKSRPVREDFLIIQRASLSSKSSEVLAAVSADRSCSAEQIVLEWIEEMALRREHDVWARTVESVYKDLVVKDRIESGALRQTFYAKPNPK